MAIGPSCSQVKIDEFIERTTLYSGEPKCFDIEIIADAISHKSPALSGQHSQVVSAQDTFDGSTVVIKSYNKAKMQHGHIRNVQREIDVMVVLGDSDCKGVVRMLYAFEDEESYHLVYEPCMRGDLYQMKCRQGTLDENYVALSVVIPLLSTLSVLHSLSIVHRDIKAENIFVSATGELRLGDFGLAAHTVHDPLVDRVGTLDYMVRPLLSTDDLDPDPALMPLRPLRSSLYP
jgi:serine/threonine protein kinase